MKKSLTKRESLILYLTIFLVIFAILFNFLILPVITKINNVNREIKLVQAKLNKYSLLLSRKDYIQNQYSKFSSVQVPLGQREDSLVGTLKELENLARQANIRIIDIRPQGPSKNLTSYQETLVDLKTEGAIEGYFNFIYHLENSPVLLRINKFQLTAKTNTEVLTGSFTISQLSQ
jgi:hypothetical protein